MELTYWVELLFYRLCMIDGSPCAQRLRIGWNWCSHRLWPPTNSFVAIFLPNATSSFTPHLFVPKRFGQGLLGEGHWEYLRNIMWIVENRYCPVIEIFAEGTRERRVAIGFKMNSTSHFLRFVNLSQTSNCPIWSRPKNALSNLYYFHSLYVEAVATGITVNCLPRFNNLHRNPRWRVR